MTVRIIVNADDLGMSDAVDYAIFCGMQRGIVTSATMLANGPSIVSAARSVPGFPVCSFGVHLNLTEFEPLLVEGRTALATILDERGHFNGNAIRRVRITAAMLRAIFGEWCAQIQKVIGLGVQPSHLDGHHHVHTIPQLLPILAAVRRRFKIKKVRISRNLYHPNDPATPSLLAKKRAFNLALRAIGFRTTQVFTDLETFVTTCAASEPGKSSFELMTHPGSDNGSEPQLLQADWRQRLSYPAELLSYHAL